MRCKKCGKKLTQMVPFCGGSKCLTKEGDEYARCALCGALVIPGMTEKQSTCPNSKSNGRHLITGAEVA